MKHLGWCAAVAVLSGCAFPATDPGGFRLATFSADITPPLGHALCAGMVAPAARVVDRLEVRGWTLLGAGAPVVFAALDWTELRNDAYDRWRDALADAAGTSRERVLVCCVHQHDAPYADLAAQRLLDEAGLKGAIIDPAFHEESVSKAARALAASLRGARTITHLGTGQAEVERVASSRRVVLPGGRVTFKRYSRTYYASNRDLPEGRVDRWLKTLSFWDGEQPVAALSVYATHPMSRYGGGGVSADFPGMARARRQAEEPSVFQVYASGCSGDVTAGKYNGGDDAAREALAGRLHEAMRAAWKGTRTARLGRVEFRSAALRLDPPETPDLAAGGLRKTLENAAAPRLQRILAALGLSWRDRVARGRPIDLPVLDFGGAQLAVLPAEAFVEFQLAAQRMRPDSFVVVAGYGECAPGYIPTEEARREGYVEEHGYCWVAPGAERRILSALRSALAR